MFKRIAPLLFCLVFVTCNKNEFKSPEKEFSRLDIRVPAYYSKYDYRKFWEEKGVKFWGFGNMPTYHDDYKDSISTNFLRFNFNFALIMDVPKDQRIKFLYDEMRLKPIELNEHYEIYAKVNPETVRYPNALHYISKFISIKDSVDVTISYETFDKDSTKLNDYKKIVTQITSELKSGSKFKTQEKRPPRNRVIAN